VEKIAKAVESGQVARIDREAKPHVDRVLAPRYTALGSVTGRLEMISVHLRPKFNVYDIRTRRAVQCRFQPEQLDSVKDALGKTVVVTGKIQRNVNGDALRLDVDEIMRWPLAESIPGIEQIYGIDPDFTGRDTTEEHLAMVRD
jgi:hypothetical protein